MPLVLKSAIRSIVVLLSRVSSAMAPLLYLSLHVPKSARSWKPRRPLPLPLERIVRQLHHPHDRREVRSEHQAPGLHTVRPRPTAGPATDTVNDLVNLLWRGSGLVGRVHMNLDMVHRVPHGNIRRDSDQLFGLAV